MMNGPAADWAARMKAFTPGFLASNPVLAKVADCASVLLHGSTTLGIDDPWSDLDGWVLVPARTLADLRRTSNDWFFEFTLHGKPGHFNLESQEGFDRRLRHCDLTLIAELRRAAPLSDPHNWGSYLINLANQPMRPDVRHAWFRYHYIEMRSEHRACDNPIERGDSLGVLLAMTKALTHAMQAAMALDGHPYPYSKWLARACGQTPTGQKILPRVQEALDLLGCNALRRPGPEKGHPLSDKLRDIRRVLIEAAKVGGVDEPWLDKWWLSCEQAARAVRDATWTD